MLRFDTPDGPIEISRRWMASDVGRLRQHWLAASRRMRDRRKQRSESGEKAKWYDLLDLFPPVEDLSVFTVILISLATLLLLWFVAVPLLVPLIGLLGQLAWLLLLIPIVFAWKVLARRPWLVDATSADGRRLVSGGSPAGSQVAVSSGRSSTWAAKSSRSARSDRIFSTRRPEELPGGDGVVLTCGLRHSTR